MNSKFLIVALALALVVLSAKMVWAGSEESTSTPHADILETIRTRTSVRAYTNQPVEADKVEKLLRAAMAAPTGMNKQPWHFVVVNEKAVLNRLAETNPYAKMLTTAPLAIVVCGDMEKAAEGEGREMWIQDCSAASENLLLAAHAMGLGAVWTGVYPGKTHCDAVAGVLNLPSTLIPLNIIVIGYPQKKQEPKDKWKPENISYNRYGNTEK